MILSPHTSSISPPLPFLSLHTNTVSQLWQEASSSNQKAERGRDLVELILQSGEVEGGGQSGGKRKKGKVFGGRFPCCVRQEAEKKTKSGFLKEPEPSKKHSSVEHKNPLYLIVMPQLDNMTALNHASFDETAFTTPASFNCRRGKFLESL